MPGRRTDVTTRSAAAAFVVNSLAAKAQSVAEIEAKLARRGVSAADAASVVAEAARLGYLDDAELAGQLARGFVSRAGTAVAGPRRHSVDGGCRRASRTTPWMPPTATRTRSRSRGRRWDPARRWTTQPAAVRRPSSRGAASRARRRGRPFARDRPSEGCAAARRPDTLRHRWRRRLRGDDDRARCSADARGDLGARREHRRHRAQRRAARNPGPPIGSRAARGTTGCSASGATTSSQAAPASTASTAAPAVTSRTHRSARAWRGTARSFAAPPLAAVAFPPPPAHPCLRLLRRRRPHRPARSRLHAARPRHLPVDERGCALDRRAPHPGDRRLHQRIALDMDPLIPGRWHRDPGGSLVLVHALRPAEQLLDHRDRHPDDVHDLRPIRHRRRCVRHRRHQQHRVHLRG